MLVITRWYLYIEVKLFRVTHALTILMARRLSACGADRFWTCLQIIHGPNMRKTLKMAISREHVDQHVNHRI